MLFMCSARARRCRAQCDVLVIRQFVTILPHIICRMFVFVILLIVLVLVLVLVVVVLVLVLVVLVACSCCCCCCCCCAVVLVLVLVVLATWLIYFRVFVDPKFRQIGCVFAYF